MSGSDGLGMGTSKQQIGRIFSGRGSKDQIAIAETDVAGIGHSLASIERIAGEVDQFASPFLLERVCENSLVGHLS